MFVKFYPTGVECVMCPVLWVQFVRVHVCQGRDSILKQCVFSALCFFTALIDLQKKKLTRNIKKTHSGLKGIEKYVEKSVRYGPSIAERE